MRLIFYEPHTPTRKTTLSTPTPQPYPFSPYKDIKEGHKDHPTTFRAGLRYIKGIQLNTHYLWQKKLYMYVLYICMYMEQKYEYYTK
jgi:hypothetical protein